MSTPEPPRPQPHRIVRRHHANAPARAALRAARCLLTVLPLATGCLVGPHYQRPLSRLPQDLGDAPHRATPGTTNVISTIEAGWWHAFHDPILDRLQSLANTNNPDLHLAEARLREARALWSEARFDLAPTTHATAGYENTQGSVVSSSGGATRDARHNEVYRAGFDATWELDLFGRVRRSIEATRATVASVEAVRDDVLISLRAEVAANYLSLRGFQAQLAATRASATNQAASLNLVETLRDGGRTTQLDVSRASAQLNATLAIAPPIEAAIDRSIHHLGILCGLPPRELAGTLLPHAPIPVATNNLTPPDPAELLRRRPDVRAAERNLAATTARIGVDVADLFPRVTFSGRIAMEAARIGRIDDGGTDSWGFGPRISWSALDLGKARQRVKASTARSEAALAQYEHTVLLVLEETENALANYTRQTHRLALLRAAARDALQAVSLARQRYEDGLTDFLTVLDAERVVLTQDTELAATEANVGVATIALYKTLGGGWAPAD